VTALRQGDDGVTDLNPVDDAVVGDTELVRRVADGDQRAMSTLYARYAARAFTLARHLCRDEQIAEDVVQEALVAFWRHPERFDPNRGKFSSWLLTLVHHKAIDAIRRETSLRRHTARTLIDDDPWPIPAGPSAEDAALDAVAASQVLAALTTLSAPHRHTLALAFWGGYTQREIAAITNVPLGTVKSRTFTAMTQLRRLLAPLLDASADDPSEPTR
jgi:RNA polymerase sigma factor (sigma-70 family)